jgi:hypothetical protein
MRQKDAPTGPPGYLYLSTYHSSIHSLSLFACYGRPSFTTTFSFSGLLQELYKLQTYL